MSKPKTWEDECLPQLHFRNRSGAVALCIIWKFIKREERYFPSPGEAPELGVIGNLRTPLGISWFLRGLWQLPHITTVVVWGDDLTKSGEALLKLWEKGPTAEHQIPTFGWRIDPLIDAEAINELRQIVRLVDARTVKRDELRTFLAELRPQNVPPRTQREFPPVPVPERSILPSSGMPIALVAKDPSDGWIQALQTVMRCGRVRVTRKGEKIAHSFCIHAAMPVPEEETIAPCFDFSPKDFETYYRSFTALVRTRGNDYGYGERMQNWRGRNQLEDLVARLKRTPDTKRGTVVLLEPLDLEELEDAPCLSLFTFSWDEDGKLSSSWVLRSHDIYGGWPANVLAALRLHRKIAKDLRAKLGIASFLSQNAQIYERDWKAAEEKLHEFGITPENAMQRIGFEADPAGNFVFTVLREERLVKVEMMNPTHDEVLWEATHHNPSALVRWIIATMPWLTDEHKRYLGAEEAKLRRTLETGEEYIQD